MKKKTQSRMQPVGKLHRVPDFLPSPQHLFEQEVRKKITLELDQATVDFFKAKAIELKTPYQRMMREVLRLYGVRYAIK